MNTRRDALERIQKSEEPRSEEQQAADALEFLWRYVMTKNDAACAGAIADCFRSAESFMVTGRDLGLDHRSRKNAAARLEFSQSAMKDATAMIHGTYDHE